MDRIETTELIKATLNAFGPGEAISMDKDTWAKLHEAMSVLIEQLTLNLQATPISGWGRQSIGMSINAKAADWDGGEEKSLTPPLDQQKPAQEPVAWTATRLWNRKDNWTCPADIEKDLIDHPQAREPLTADDLREPKNGTQWRVEWWNESCRMMLPSDAKLDSFTSYKNGTMQFTIKKAAHGIKRDV